MTVETNNLRSDEFIDLSKAAGWGKNRKYDMSKVTQALSDTTLTVVVRDQNNRAIGCGRAFSDDLLMTFIPDIFVHPDFQRQGIGSLIVETLKSKFAHTSFYFGAQAGNETFFEKLGFSKSLQSYGGKFGNNPYYE